MTLASVHYRLEVVRPPDPFDPQGPPDLTGLEKVGRVDGGEVFASAALKTEIDMLRDRGGLYPDAVYHGTNSAALPAIALYKGILSSRQLIARGYMPRTGETAELRRGAGFQSQGLEDVYASRDAVVSSYSFARGNAYPVIFGIRSNEIADAYGDGLKLGPRVPLENIVSLTVPHQQLPKAQQWAFQHCPQSAVMSQEAASVLYYGHE